MILWCIFALMTAAAIFAVLWPLGRSPQKLTGGSDILVYKDQLREIDRDRSAGLLGEAEAEAARLEVSRRLLAAADEASPAAPAVVTQQNLNRRRAAAVAALIILPFAVPGLYVALGSPNVVGEPAFARVQTPQGRESIASLVSKVEAHLARDPQDGAGWEVIAPVYMRLGRFDDAVEARKKALALGGETAGRDADLGEAEAAAANGQVTADAKAAFERAIALDPREAKARYYLGLAAEQDGKSEEAANVWRSLLADTPAGAPWVGFVRESLARVTGAPVTASGPSAEDVAAAANLSESKRGEMIRGMVARLADRLHENGADIEGWLGLVRAYVVLGDRDKAKGAAADAKRALADHPDEVKRIDELIKNLGLEG
ncbi:MAG TPA: c-type cytochrome biogenesis protein CcmI [Xanthobacteraceae bacterium]|nr:c-type cytochrome biogenesis protein CcmI [Xanthobacteraceae bacterium]